MSICTLALQYKVNKGNLRAHLDPNNISIDVFNAIKQALSPTQEDVLIWWVIEMANQNLALQPCVTWEKSQLITQAAKPGVITHPRWVD